MSAMAVMTRLAIEWATRCFGEDRVFDPQQRALRTAEEAVELAQACGVPQAQLEHLIQIVYQRPHGSIGQEIGGVLMTTVVFCEAAGMDPERMLEDELARVLAKPPAHFTHRDQQKIAAGLS